MIFKNQSNLKLKFVIVLNIKFQFETFEIIYQEKKKKNWVNGYMFLNITGQMNTCMKMKFQRLQSQKACINRSYSPAPSDVNFQFVNL